MKELIRTNDLILISRIRSVLNDAGINFELLDTHTSIIEGSISAIQNRILVFDEDLEYSNELIQDLINDHDNK